MQILFWCLVKKTGQVGIITPIVSLFSTKKNTSQRFKLGVKNINYYHYYHQSSFLRDTRNSYSNTRGYRPEKKLFIIFTWLGQKSMNWKRKDHEARRKQPARNINKNVFTTHDTPKSIGKLTIAFFFFCFYVNLWNNAFLHHTYFNVFLSNCFVKQSWNLNEDPK